MKQNLLFMLIAVLMVAGNILADDSLDYNPKFLSWESFFY